MNSKTILVPLDAVTSNKLPMSVGPSWLGPVMERFQQISELLHSKGGDVSAELDRMIDTIPDLYSAMDHDALAATLERALGASVVHGVITSKAASDLSGLASDDFLGVPFGPFEEAAAFIDRKTPIGSALNSLEWQRVPAELRDRAMFSARVESAKFLTEAKDRLSSELRIQREQLANGKQAFFSRNDFIARMREVAEDEGIDTSDGTFDGSVRDIRSSRRLGLVYDVQTEMAGEYGRYKMAMDPDVLDAYPAKRLVRVEEREHKRNWTQRWRAAANEVNWVGVHRGADMVALTTSPVWTKLGPFQNPFPPFDYGSGMGTEDVDRSEAESLGLVQPDVPVDVPDETVQFNQNLEAGIEDVDVTVRDSMLQSFGDMVSVVGNVIRWVKQLK
jgi:hypothetical protein